MPLLTGLGIMSEIKYSKKTLKVRKDIQNLLEQIAGEEIELDVHKVNIEKAKQEVEKMTKELKKSLWKDNKIRFCETTECMNEISKKKTTCRECGGSGEVHSHNPKCYGCNGMGEVVHKICDECHNKERERTRSIYRRRTGEYE